MNWDNLKQKKCPICGRRLLMAHLYMRCSGRRGGVYKINQTKSLCTFTISKDRYAELGGFIPAKHKNSFYFMTRKEIEEQKITQEKVDAEKKIRRKAKKARYLERKKHTK